MKESRILIVYYSRTGTTRRIAEAIQRGFGGELIEVRTQRYPKGLRGYLRAGMDAGLGRAVPIQCKEPSASAYDLVIVGTPVWNSSLAAPIRTYLSQALPQAKQVAFFLTLGGSGARRVFRQMEQLCGRRPLLALAATTSEVRRRKYADKVERFVRSLQGALELPKVA